MRGFPPGPGGTAVLLAADTGEGGSGGCQELLLGHGEAARLLPGPLPAAGLGGAPHAGQAGGEAHRLGEA